MSQGEVLNPNDAVATPQEQNLEALIENYTGTPVENPEPPTTIVFECNKSLAVQDGLATTTNSWVNNFPSVKLRKGDMVSINSAFLSSRGSGDLLQFDETNNKTRLVFEYYCSNDNVNGKRIEYNIKGRVDNDNFDNFHYYDAPQGQQMPFLNCYPVNYRPMPLYRLMNTFNLTTSANGGLDLLPFTDTTTNPASAVKEPFWGYKTASAQIEAIIEDDYVPGLFRDATLNISEPNFISWNGQNGYQKGSWNGDNNAGLRIWYVSTRNSKLGACSSNASMRIYLGFAEGNADDATATASLQFLRSIRPGQYIKFLNPGGLWNIDAFNGNSYLTTSPTKQYGTNCYYCNGYASNGNGFTNSDGVMVDKFKQIGNFDDWEWVNNPMGQIMRVSKIYFETGAGFPNGRAHIGGSGANWLSHIPYFEVQCAGSMSFAWGCPNAWEYPVPDPTGDTADVFKGMPYSGGADIAQADITNSSLPPTNLTMSPYGACNIRLLACENNSLYKNITNWNSKVGNNSTHASYYPAQRALDKTLYCASIPYFKDGSQQYMSGDYNNNGDGLLYENAENNLANNLNNSDNFKAGVSTGTQNFNPMNYNLQTLDITGEPEYPKTMVYSDFYFSENTYNGEELENTYAGGRLPVVYQTENEISTDTSNYITALRKHAYNFGSSGRRTWFQSNRSADNTDVNGNSGFYSTYGRNLNVFQYRDPSDNNVDTLSGDNGTPAGKLPYQQKNLNNISDKYCNTGKGSIWFYQALNIDNTTDQFVPSTQAGTPMPLAPGDSMFGANQTSE